MIWGDFETYSYAEFCAWVRDVRGWAREEFWGAFWLAVFIWAGVMA